MWASSETGVVEDLLGVAAGLDGDAIAIGTAGTIVRYAVGRWTREPVAFAEDLYAICSAGVAVGGNLDVGGHSKVVRYRDGAWTVESSRIQSLLLAVAACGDEVRAVGFNGGVVASTPDSWRELDAGTNEHLFAIAPCDDDCSSRGSTARCAAAAARSTSDART